MGLTIARQSSAPQIWTIHAWEPNEMRTCADIAMEDLKPLSPQYVAQWLSSVGKGVPSPVLAKLRDHIVKQGIDGVALEDILDNFRFETIRVDDFTPVHLNRVRKAWY